MSPLAAVDNLTLLEVMRTGDPGTKPGPAARAFFHETVGAAFRNPALRNAYLNNAWNLWRNVLSNPREWDGYTDKIAVRRQEFGATSIVVDAHGIPTAVQANPNDAQNDLRFKKYRPEYRQATILLSRDEYIPITVDPVSVGRMLSQGFESDGASRFLAAQLTQVLNTDRAREFNTLMDAWSRYVTTPGVYYTHTADLDPATITPAQAIASAVTIRAAVKNLADFTNRFSLAKNPQTVPAAQVRLVIAVSAMEALGVGYTGAFNPEYALALPADQVVEVPDRYFAERPEFAGMQVQWALVDAGEDQGDGGTFVVVDSLYEQGADPFNITQTYNQALHHASFLDLNPFKTMIVGGAGEGSQIVEVQPVPATITLDVYTDQGVITPTSGDLPRGVEFSTQVRVLDSSGSPAGGYEVTITGATSPTGGTGMLRYSDGKISNDELSSTITVTATSLINPSITVSHTYDVVGPVIDLLSGNTIVNPITFPGVFAPGSGSGGTYTYTAATGVVYEKSTTLDGARTPLGASPVAVATGVTIYVHATAASGYVFADGSSTKVSGPHTAA
jgi:hypothetical protein